jgi:signal transduction histidine kinase
VRLYRHDSRLRLKIIAWSFVPTAIILFLVALTVYAAYQQTARDLILNRDEELTRLMASEISASFEDFIDRLTALSRTLGLNEDTPVIEQAVLADFRNRLIFYDAGVYVMNNLGIVTAIEPEATWLIGSDWSNRSFFRSMVRTPGLTITDIEAVGPRGEDVIVLAMPILSADEEFRGVVAGMFRLDPSAISPFYGALIKLRIGGSGEAYMVDGNGRIVFASNASLIGQRYPDREIADRVLGKGVGVFTSEPGSGASTVTGYAPIPRTNWTLIVQEDWGSLAESGLLYREFLILLLALGLAVPTLVVMIGVGRITGPIKEFTAAAGRIADGDFSQPIKVKTGDELEVLADQFNAMAERLNELYATMELRVSQRTHELTALNSLAEIVSRSLDMEEILPDALSKAIEVLGMDAGGVHILEPGSDTLHMVAHKGISEEMRAMIRLMPLNYSIIQEVVETRHPVARLVRDYPPGRVRETLENDGWKTVVSIPLLAQERVLGAINVSSSDETILTQEDLAVPASIGQQIGVALDNARLYNQTVDYARQAELARQAAEAARAAAEAANAAKSDFLANVSHELRTPLVSIFGFARMIKKRLEERIFPLLPSNEGKVLRAESQIDENLEIILNEGQRLMSLINNLLDFEKNESGKMEWNPRPVSMSWIIKTAAANTRALFEGGPLTLELDVPESLPQVYGDPNRLLQVVINLISNAVKFTSEGTIRIHARREDDEVVVSVIDQGIGIAPKDQARVFEKFSQVGDSLTSKPKGTGLGLAISKQIIDRHSGKIWFESELDKGSTFSFSLPIMKDDNDSRREDDRTEDPTDVAKEGTP